MVLVYCYTRKHERDVVKMSLVILYLFLHLAHELSSQLLCVVFFSIKYGLTEIDYFPKNICLNLSEESK